MRSNLPVTNVEYVLKDTETVVSKTDIHGNTIFLGIFLSKLQGL